MSTFGLVRLTRRKLLKIYGPDCFSYLQGILCNDLRCLYHENLLTNRKFARSSINVLSSFMLNAQGRAICDMLLYRTPQTRSEAKFSPPGKETEQDELLIECDSDLASGLANTLYGYRVRRKISLAYKDDLSVWCLYPKNSKKDIGSSGTDLVILDPQTDLISNDLTVVCDPRLYMLGARVLADTNQDFESVKTRLQSLINVNIERSSLGEYITHRYSLGVGEGRMDHPESDCLPLECNADYLNSVSFNKGCYLGQELTARIYFTGVVRKRLMPIVLDPSTGSRELGTLPPLPGTDIVNESKKKVGIIRAVSKSRGLALLRYELALSSEKLIHHGSGTSISTCKPDWWNQR